MTSDGQPNISFAEAYRAFLLAKRSENVTKSLLSLYDRTRTLWLQRCGDMLLQSIDPNQIRVFLLWLQGEDDSAGEAPHNQSGQPLAGATVDIHFRNLRAMLRWCESEELIIVSPMRKVKRPRFAERLPDALTEAEVKHLLQSVRESGDRNAFRDYVLLMFFLGTGVRLFELVGLDVDDVDIDQGIARVMRKGRKEGIARLKSIRLRRDLLRYIMRHRRAAAGEKALFINEYGFRLETGGVQMVVRRDLKRFISRELRRGGPHTLRHTFATLELRKSRNLKRVSMLLGHTTTRTTERYAHLTEVDLADESESSPLDDLLADGRRRYVTPNGSG